MANEANILIIGAGVAGGLVAELLVQAGYDGIVILEAGPIIKMRNPRIWLDTVTQGTVPYANLYDDPTDFQSSGVEPWQIVGGRLFGRGGSTIHWGGWCPRFMPEDFQLFTNTGQGIDWPYSYADLEPYYVQAEQYLQVAGETIPGQRDWRSAPYPMAAASYPITAGPVIEALEALNISYQQMPVARNTVAINGQAQCMTNTTCQYCPIGARFTGDQPIDRAEASNQVTLITNAAVLAILMSSKTTATGVQYLDTTTGNENTINANAIFLCAGAFETPKLLLASQNAYWANGIGNDYGLVGAYLVANPYLYCRGTAPANPQLLQQELSFPTLCSRQWDTPDQQATGKFLMNMSYSAPFLATDKLMFQGADAVTVAQAVTGSMGYELQGGVSPFPYLENRVSLLPGTTRFGLPKTNITTPTSIVPASTLQNILQNLQNVMTKMGFQVTATGYYPQRGDHAASTCRMSITPEQGVVDPTMRLFGTNNIFIASNAILPTIGAANLTLTLTATILKAMAELLASSSLPTAP